jgi:hypothetical protein
MKVLSRFRLASEIGENGVVPRRRLAFAFTSDAIVVVEIVEASVIAGLRWATRGSGTDDAGKIVADRAD